MSKYLVQLATSNHKQCHKLTWDNIDRRSLSMHIKRIQKISRMVEHHNENKPGHSILPAPPSSSWPMTICNIISPNFPCEKMPALASVSFPGQSTVKAKNGMEIGHGDESIASKISKAHLKVSKCNPLAINSHVRPSAALSYQTVKLRCLGTLVCLVLSNFRAPGKQRETRWLVYKQIVPLEVQTRQIEMIEHLRMKKTWEMFHLQFEQTDSFTTWPTNAAFPVTSRLSPLHVHIICSLHSVRVEMEGQ